VTEGSGADRVPRPWVLDVSVLVAVARADAEVTNLVIILDGRGQPLIIPVLAVVAASGDVRTDDGDIALRGLERLENSLVAPLQNTEQATRLAAIAAKTELTVGDAHVAAVALVSACPILTLEADEWRQHARDLGEPLDIIEIADLPDSADSQNGGSSE
jgi:predicted nucleic acid-binding protein